MKGSIILALELSGMVITDGMRETIEKAIDEVEWDIKRLIAEAIEEHEARTPDRTKPPYPHPAG